MRIGKKILLSFTVIVISIVVMGYLTITAAQESLIDSIGQDYSESLSDTLYEIEQGLEEKTIGLITLSDKNLVYDVLINSNLKFANFTNSQINATNTLWISALTQNQTIPTMDEIRENSLSQKLTSSSHLIENKYNYPIYDEIALFNQYGVLVAYGGSIPPYYVQDMRWWTTTLSNGYFTEVSYDDNEQTYLQNIAIQITDEKGDFLGILMIKIKLSDIISTIHSLQQKSKFSDSDMMLIDAKGRLLYSTTNFTFGEYIPLAEFLLMSDKSGYFIVDNADEPDMIKVYAHTSKSNLNPKWTLVTQKDLDEILLPVVRLTNMILIILITTLSSAFIIGLYIKTSIAKPLIELRNASSMIADGNFDVTLNIKTDDEIGDLADRFEYMKDSINFTNANLTDLVRMRTTELENAMNKMERDSAWTKNLMEFVSSQTNNYIKEISTNLSLLETNQLTKDEALQSANEALLQLKLLSTTISDMYDLEHNQLKYNMQDVSINKIIKSSVEHMSQNKVKMNLDLTDDVFVYADKTYLIRAIRNIVDVITTHIGNGILQINTIRDKNDIAIQITSPNIDPDILSPLTAKSYEDIKMDYISLYTSQLIIKAHAGMIALNYNDSGTTVTISFPMLEDLKE